MDFLLPHVDEDEAARSNMHVNPILSPYFAAGRVLSPTFFTNLVTSCVRLPQLPELVEELLLGCGGQGCLLQWPVPADLAGRSYGELFERFVTRFNAMPLGLLRAGNGCCSPLPYVLTNPYSALRLAADDRVFVVAKAHPEGRPGLEHSTAPPSIHGTHVSSFSGPEWGVSASKLRAALSVPRLPVCSPLRPPSAQKPANLAMPDKLNVQARDQMELPGGSREWAHDNEVEMPNLKSLKDVLPPFV